MLSGASNKPRPPPAFCKGEKARRSAVQSVAKEECTSEYDALVRAQKKQQPHLIQVKAAYKACIDRAHSKLMKHCPAEYTDLTKCLYTHPTSPNKCSEEEAALQQCYQITRPTQFQTCYPAFMTWMDCLSSESNQCEHVEATFEKCCQSVSNSGETVCSLFAGSANGVYEAEGLEAQLAMHLDESVSVPKKLSKHQLYIEN